MGFAVSWIAFREKTKDEVLSAVELTDTGERDEWRESPVSGAQLSDGWYILFFNEYGHPLVLPESLERLSRGCQLLACNVEEHVMASSAEMHTNGKTVWSVAHQGDGDDVYDLTVEGSLPAPFDAIRQRLTEAQDREGKPPEVDHIFDIPLALAHEICGFKHDEENRPSFTRLKATNAPARKSIWPWRR